MTEHLFLGLAGIIVLGIAAQWLAWYIRVPSIFLLLLAVIAAFAVTNHLHDETGLFTVTVMGIVMANQRNIIVRHIIGFEETLGMLLISNLFILLSARLQLSDLAHIGWSSLAFLGMLIVIARPAAVAFSTDETYQLSPGETVDDPALHLRGRFLFDETANYILTVRPFRNAVRRIAPNMAKKAQLPHPERTKIVHLITNLLPSHMWSGKQSGTDFEPYFISCKNTMGYKILQTPKKMGEP